MKSQTLSDLLTTLTVVLLVVLTAWGNAVAMLVVSALGLVIGVLTFRRHLARGGALAAISASLVAVLIALVVWSR